MFDPASFLCIYSVSPFHSILSVCHALRCNSNTDIDVAGIGAGILWIVIPVILLIRRARMDGRDAARLVKGGKDK